MAPWGYNKDDGGFTRHKTLTLSKTNSFILVVHYGNVNRSLPGIVLRHSRFLNLLICLEFILFSVGPANWYKECPIASTGERQSPIDLKVSEAKHDSKLKPVVVSYPTFNDAKLLNNGHSVTFLPDVGQQSGNNITLKPVRVHA